MSDYDALIAPEERIEIVRRKAGQTIEQILLKQSELDIYEMLGSIEVLVGSKIYKNLETSASERMVFAFTWLAREVGTGGFRQFFVNSAGDFWKDALLGLTAIKDEKGLSLFRKTLSIFPDSAPSEDRLRRLRQLRILDEADADKVAGHFNEMTDQYFRNPFPQWDALFEYVKKHRKDFDLRNA